MSNIIIADQYFGLSTKYIHIAVLLVYAYTERYIYISFGTWKYDDSRLDKMSNYHPCQFIPGGQVCLGMLQMHQGS